MNIDSKFLGQQWFRAIAAEFGPAGQIVVIRLFVSIFESDEGYWRRWSMEDGYALIEEIPGLDFDTLSSIIGRMCQYGVIAKERLRAYGILTSELIQREFIRQHGVARARRLTWREHSDLTNAELLELGVIPALPVDGSGADPDEPMGQEIPLPRSHPFALTMPDLRCVRVRCSNPGLRLYRPVVERKKAAPAT
ncbi:MAG: DUF4373 domain-containing protein [Muribaculaceae bacterium]|nr:DUF4373 domain-containing protein [Muribaculaceae bacterium]